MISCIVHIKCCVEIIKSVSLISTSLFYSRALWGYMYAVCISPGISLDPNRGPAAYSNLRHHALGWHSLHSHSIVYSSKSKWDPISKSLSIHLCTCLCPAKLSWCKMWPANKITKNWSRVFKLFKRVKLHGNHKVTCISFLICVNVIWLLPSYTMFSSH